MQVLLPALAKTFAAGLLTWVGLCLFRAVRNPRTPRGDAVLLDLGLGLVAVAATVLWVSVLLEIHF
jgi:hypothetical protein